MSPVDYQSTVRVESEVVPGVFYTLRKMSDARRAQLRLATAESNSCIRILTKELMAIELRPEDQRDPARIAEIHEQMETEVIAKLNPAWLRWGLKSIENYNVDGEPATADSLVEAGQPELVQEIVYRAKHLAQMTEAELKNLPWLSTSGTGTEASAMNTSATDASGKGPSEAVIADATFPA